MTDFGGPWKTKAWSDNESGVIDRNGSDVCGYAFNEVANLIAAAPNLYDAVAAAESYFAALPADDAVVHPLYLQMNAALAKARGE